MLTGNPEAVKVFHGILNIPSREKEVLRKQLKASKDPLDKKLLKYLDNSSEKLEKIEKKTEDWKLSHVLKAMIRSKQLRDRLKKLTGERYSLRKE